MLCPICGYERGSDFLSAPDRFHRREMTYQLVRCTSCSLVWLCDPPKLEEMPYHYETDYHQAISTAGIESDWRQPRERVLEMVQGGALLDIGCNSGGFLRRLKGNAWKLYGIEISPTQAQMAETNSGAQVFVGDILGAPFSPSSFDVITGFHVLEHVYRPKDVVSRLWEWLKPGGILYLRVPNIDALEARIFRSYWYGLELPRHLYHFSPATLRRLLASMDFDEVLVHTMSYTHVEASMLYVLDELRAKIGISPAPGTVVHGPPGMAWRIVRKALRLGLLSPLGCLAAAMGRGAGIEAVFRKRS